MRTTSTSQLAIREIKAPDESFVKFSIEDIEVDYMTMTVRGERGIADISPQQMRMLVFIKHNRVFSKPDMRGELCKRTTVSHNALDKVLFDVKQVLKKTTRRIRIKSIYGRGYVVETGEDIKWETF